MKNLGIPVGSNSIVLAQLVLRRSHTIDWRTIRNHFRLDHSQRFRPDGSDSRLQTRCFRVGALEIQNLQFRVCSSKSAVQSAAEEGEIGVLMH